VHCACAALPTPILTVRLSDWVEDFTAASVGFITGTPMVGFNAATQSVTHGALSAAFSLSGSYAANGFHSNGSDGHGGTDVGFS
jgi:hypothetical protein